MKKWVFVLTGIVGFSIHAMDEWRPIDDEATSAIEADNPLARGVQSVVTVTSEKMKELSDQVLQSFNINVPAIRRSIDHIKIVTSKIRKEVGILQGTVNQPLGPINQIRKVVKASADLKAALPGKRYFAIIRLGEHLIFEIDRMELSPLLKPSQRLLRLFKELFEYVLKLREETGRLGKLVISPEVAVLLSNGVVDLGLLADNLVDFIAGGKRTLKLAQPQLIGRLISERGKLHLLEEKLSELETKILPLLYKFVSSVSSIGTVIVPLAVVGTNISGELQKRIEERRKGTRTGIVGPRIRYQELKAIMMQLHTNLYTLLESAHDAVGAITDIIELTVANVINAFDEALKFKILKTKADRAAQKIPVNARSLKKVVSELYQQLVAPSQQEFETEEVLIDFNW